MILHIIIKLYDIITILNLFKKTPPTKQSVSVVSIESVDAWEGGDVRVNFNKKAMV